MKNPPRMVVEGHLGGYIDGGDEGTFYPRLWDWAIQRWGLRSVLDVGCGQGHSARYFLDRGCRVLGLDGSRQALDETVIPGRVALHDFCEGPWRDQGSWDLVWSAEFLEHIEPEYLPHVLATFAQAGRAIMVTHGLPGQEGHHHVNCQASSYWIEWFERLGFRCSVSASIQARKLVLSDYPGKKFFAESGLVFLREAATSEATIAAAVAEAAACRGQLEPAWTRGTSGAARVKGWAIHSGLHGSPSYRLWRLKRRWRRRAQRRAAAADASLRQAA